MGQTGGKHLREIPGQLLSEQKVEDLSSIAIRSVDVCKISKTSVDLMVIEISTWKYEFLSTYLYDGKYFQTFDELQSVDDLIVIVLST